MVREPGLFAFCGERTTRDELVVGPRLKVLALWILED